MGIPKLKLVSKKTKKEIEKAELMTKLFNELYSEQDFKYQIVMTKLMEIEHEKNPLGLIKVIWGK